MTKKKTKSKSKKRRHKEESEDFGTDSSMSEEEVGGPVQKVYDKGKNKKLLGLNAYLQQKALKKNLTSQATIGLSEAEQTEDEKLLDLKQGGAGMGFSTVIQQKDSDLDFRSNFISEYGVDINFPAFYSADGVLAPHAKNFIISSGFHIIPRNNDQVVQITTYDDHGKGRVYDTHFGQMYE